MNRRWMRVSAAVLIAVMTMMMAMKINAEEKPDFSTNASASALIDFESGKLLIAENQNAKLPMASTTKIMTALVVLESCDTDDIVVTAKEAEGVEGSSIGLSSGERIKVIDLLYGLMLASGNDAAVALAVHTAGSVKDFAMMMNKKAEEIGLVNTHFVTPNGLHAEGHYTTAYELCMTAREALKNETFKKIVSTEYYTAGSGEKARTFKNKNKLLWEYDGAIGVKTGYTKAAGRCLVFCAEKDGKTFIGSVLNCRPMFETAKAMLDQAFECYEKVCVVEKDKVLYKFYIENSGGVLEVGIKSSIMTLMQRSSEASFRAEPVFFRQLSAPVLKGDSVGVLKVFDDEDLIGTAELVAMNDVEPYGFLYWFRLMIGAFT